MTATKPTISDDAVKARTGKTWPQWFEILDKAGATKKNHQEIVALIARRYEKVGPWYQQMITVTYEKARGLRQDHQQPAGYEITVSRTIPMAADILFDHFNDAQRRRRWLPKAKLTIRKATRAKSMRITWEVDGTNLDVNFYHKGPRKTQVAVQHSRLPSRKAADAMKAYWDEALDRLKGTFSN